MKVLDLNSTLLAVLLTVTALLPFSTLAAGESKPKTPEQGYQLNIDLHALQTPALNQATTVQLAVSSHKLTMKQVNIELQLPEGLQLLRQPQKSHTPYLYAGTPLLDEFEFIAHQTGQYKITVTVNGLTEAGEFKDRYAYLFFTISNQSDKNILGWAEPNLDITDHLWTASEKPELPIDNSGFVTLLAADAELNEVMIQVPASEYYGDAKTNNQLGGMVTINGNYQFRNRENTAYIGFNRNLMRLINASNDNHLAWTYSDNNGNFTFPEVPNPGSDGMRVQVYSVRYLNGKGYGVCNYDTCVDQAATDSGSYDQFYFRQSESFVTADGNQDIGIYRSSHSLSNNLRALWIHQDMKLAYDHLLQHTSIRGPFTAEWSADSTHGNHYHRDGNIHFKADVGDGTNHTILHELGHNVMFNAGTFPEGTDCPSPHRMNEISGTQCAWTEGWGHIFLAVVNDDPRKCSPPSTTNCTLFETHPSYDNCQNGWDCGSFSDQVEGHVAGAVWDIYDQDEDDFDIESFPLASIYDILETDTNDSFASWWSSWLNDNNAELALNSLVQNDIIYGDLYDVRVNTPSVNDTNPEVNQDVNVGVFIRNLGDVSSIATNIIFYRSNNAIISHADVPMAIEFAGVLNKNLNRQVSESFAMDTTGTFWLGACFDDSYGFDNNTSNNCSDGVQVTVVDSDLIFENGFE